MSTCALEHVVAAPCAASVPDSRAAGGRQTYSTQPSGSPRTLACRAEKLSSRQGTLNGRRLTARHSAPALPAARRRHGLAVEAAKRVQTGRSYVLSSTLVADEDKEAEVVELCRSILRWGEEKKADRAAGVLQFECNADPFEKGVFHFWERYDRFTSMNDARASPEHCQFMNDVRPLLKAPVGLAAYEYKNGQIGHMLNPIGPKGEGGLDDATGQGGSGGGASYKQTSTSLQQGVGEASEREWGMKMPLFDATKVASKAGAGAAATIAEGLKSLFGGKKK